MQALPDNATLILIDVQHAFDDERWGRRNNPHAETNIGQLLAAWRETSRPVIHVQHRNTAPGKLFSPDQPGFAIKPQAAPRGSEPVIHKSVNSAFIGTDLESRLRHAAVTHVVICGLTTDHCVSTTTRMAGNLGFSTYLVGDACATFERVGPTGRQWTAEEMHESALASLHDEFAQVVDMPGAFSLLRPGSTIESARG
jgi:nicotinamidase-related amidase